MHVSVACPLTSSWRNVCIADAAVPTTLRRINGHERGLGTAQTVQRLATGGAVPGSYPCGGRDFSHLSRPMDTGSFPGLKQPGFGIDKPPPTPRLQNEQSFFTFPGFSSRWGPWKFASDLFRQSHSASGRGEYQEISEVAKLRLAPRADSCAILFLSNVKVRMEAQNSIRTPQPPESS